MGLYDSTKQLLGAWKDAKVRQFQGTPQTKVDSGGNLERYEFGGQSPTRKELEEVRQIRESGGVISYLVHAKALMQFGTGSEYQTENEDLIEWLDEQIPNVDNMLIELGEDAIWYPYAIAEIVETQGGGFSHIEMVEPWTMEPQENEFGEVIAWEQHVDRQKEVFEPGELASIILNKSSGRDNTGISEVLRAEEEIRGFKENRQTVNQALKYLVPHNHWIVGKESGQVIDDNELRRIRNRVEDMEGDTQFITGPDVEHNEISLQEFDYGGIQERDLREVALALGLPLELANIGSDGLGSGMPADLRLTLFERQARAAQRSLTNQVDEELIRPIIETYSPFSVDEYDGLRLSDPIAEREEMTLMDMSEYLTANEVREELDKPPIEDDELADSYQAPAQAEAEEQQPEEPGGGGGFFRDGRALQEIPDNATSIDSPDECDGQVIEGPKGGMYCVPYGDGDGKGTQPGEEIPIEEMDEGDEVVVDATINIGGEEHDISGDVVEVVIASENGLAIEHPEYGTATISADEIESVTAPEEGQADDGEDTAAAPDLLTPEQVEEANETVMRELEERHGEELFERTGGGITGAETIADTFGEWPTSGYWDGHAEPLWEAAARAGSGDGEIPDRADGENDFLEGTDAVADDVVEASREYAAEEIFGEDETITVHRGVSGELGEEIQEAVENGEPVEIDPRAMESWSMDGEYADQFASGSEGVTIEREISVEDVGIIPSVFEPELLEEQEITTVDNGPIEVPPEQITT